MRKIIKQSNGVNLVELRTPDNIVRNYIVDLPSPPSSFPAKVFTVEEKEEAFSFYEETVSKLASNK